MSAARRLLIEKKENDARMMEQRRENYNKFLKDDAFNRRAAEAEVRAEHMRQRHQDQAHRKTNDIEDKLKEQLVREQQEMQRQQLARAQQQQEESERQKIRDDKIRQALRESSMEIRELEHKLRLAYIGKDHVAQIKETEVRRAKEALGDLEYVAHLKEKIKREKEQEAQSEVKKLENSHAYRRDLQQQLKEVEDKRTEEYEQFLRDKAIIDEIVKKIMEDDEKEYKIRMQQRKETKDFIDLFIVQRQRWKEEEQQRIEEENRKIAEYAQMIEEREQLKSQKKQKEEQKRDAIYDMLAKEIEEKERSKQELEDLRIALSTEEEAEEAKRKEMRALEDRVRKRMELIDGYRAQVEEKFRLRQKEIEEENEFRAMMLEKYAREENLEQMNAQKKRMRQQEHRRAVEKLIEERRNRREEIRLQEIEAEKGLDELSRYKREVIEQERQRLLREHAVKLLGYLPKGILRDEKDLELFDEDFRKKFEPKPEEDF